MDEQSDIIAAFSEMVPRYESLMNNELNRFWGVSYEGFVSNLLADIKTGSDDQILDIATGTGYIPAFLLAKGQSFKNIFGLDLTFGMLQSAKQKINENWATESVSLLCASAHEIPITTDVFDHVICCLATHHMDVPVLLKNIHRVLRIGGIVHIADAGGSADWKNFIIKGIIKIGAFIYFLFAENFSRAIAESSAIANIFTPSEWNDLFIKQGFNDIKINQLKSRRFWAPDPIMIEASK